jgi:ubiquinone/menaquinone biosynthesis C-methylase UbiE
MGIYERWLLPRLVDLAMRNKQATRYREKLVPRAAGRVLEIGAGSGLNLPYYGRGVSRLYALEPSAALIGMARGRQVSYFPVEFLERSAEELPLPSASIDTVISTWTLCTIPDVLKALRETRRVLMPGGTLIFVEHGHAPDRAVAEWQRRLDPLWTRIAGGCHLDRPIARLVREAGFELVELENEYLRGPRPFTYTYSGLARPVREPVGR